MLCNLCGRPIKRHTEECPLYRPKPGDYPKESWKDWHLTQDGWRAGSWHRHDITTPKILPAPENALLTVRRMVTVSGKGADAVSEAIETNRKSSRDKEIQELLAKYGSCPERI